MHIVFSVERERGMGLRCREPNRTQRKTLPWGTSLLCTEYQPNQKGDSRSWQNKSDVQVFSFKVFWGHFLIFFFFFIRSDQTKQCDLCLGPNPCPFLPSLPNRSQNGSCALYIEGDQLLNSTASLKERKQKLCFSATDLAI